MPSHKILIAFLIAVSTPAAHSQDLKAAKIEELMRLTKMDQIVDQLRKPMMDQIRLNLTHTGAGKEIGPGKPSPEFAKLLAAFQDKIAGFISQAMAWDNIKSEYIRLYGEVFSDSELDGILSFYRGPAGQALLTKLPLLLTRGSAIGQKRMADIEPDLRRLINQFQTDAALIK